MRRHLIWVVMLLALAWNARAQERQTLTVFAAASLTDAFEDIAEQFEAANPGAEVIFNFGSSSTLAAQLVEGAPADVFASANVRQMEVAQEGGRIAGEPRVFARNRLVVAIPADNPASIETLHDLANPRVKLVVAASGVPVRDYTDAMLERLAEEVAYGEAYRQAFLANIVSEEDNVRQVAAKIALGEADAGLIYRSDITPDIADMVQALPIPDTVNTVAAYPIAITSDAANPDLAQAFVDNVLSRRGQAVLVSWGFLCAE